MHTLTRWPTIVALALLNVVLWWLALTDTILRRLPDDDPLVRAAKWKRESRQPQDAAIAVTVAPVRRQRPTDKHMSFSDFYREMQGKSE